MSEKPIIWMRAVRDAEPKFTAARLTVLWALALRMNADGTGYASTGHLMADVGYAEHTVRRATDDGRARGYLKRTRRGHRLGNGGVVASEWALIVPYGQSQPATTDGLTVSQPVSGGRLTESQPDSGDRLNHLNRPLTPSQPATGGVPLGPLQEVKARSAQSQPAFTPEERTAVKAEIRRRKGPDATPALLAHCFKEDGADILAELKTKATVSTALAEAAQSPQCPHGQAGGDRLHPVSGEPLCIVCRHAWRQRQPGYVSPHDRPWEA